MSSARQFIFLIVAHQNINFQGVVVEYSDLRDWNNFSIPRVKDRKYYETNISSLTRANFRHIRTHMLHEK